MEETALTSENKVTKEGWPPVAAAIVALIGLADALYLTVNHYTGEKVPCSVTGGCEKVLSSAWSEIGGIPLAAFGAVAYFGAFSMAILVAFGNRRIWALYGAMATLMAGFSVFLFYLQWAVIGAFCQFCLISAGTSATLFAIFILSRIFLKK